MLLRTFQLKRNMIHNPAGPWPQGRSAAWLCVVNLFCSTLSLFFSFLLPSLSTSLFLPLSFSFFSPSSSVLCVNVLTLQLCQWASRHHGNQSHYSLPVWDCVCVCVCWWVGSGSCFVFQKLRRGRGRPNGPLAVIHVNSLKMPAALFSLLSLKLSQTPVSSMRLDQNYIFSYLNEKIPLPQVIVYLKSLW